jgi:hypothetical protein
LIILIIIGEGYKLRSSSSFQWSSQNNSKFAPRFHYTWMWLLLSLAQSSEKSRMSN